MNLLLELALKLRRLYWRIARPQTIGARAIIVNDQGAILLVKHKYGKGWFLPGGKVKKNEDPEAGMKRELKEELGITSVQINEVLGIYTNVQEYKKDTITVYVVKQFTYIDKSHFEIESKGFFASDNLPEGTSPGTKRRIQEHLKQEPIATTW
ncbi:MAG: NUDIX domain-containing protein [bacterium]|nr:NUDIX domain-containing protein [bacterium]